MPKETEHRITQTPGVCGGKPRISGTRVRVSDVTGLLQTGETPDSIPHQLPNVTHADVLACLAYYEKHREEIDQWVKQQMAED